MYRDGLASIYTSRRYTRNIRLPTQFSNRAPLMNTFLPEMANLTPGKIARDLTDR